MPRHAPSFLRRRSRLAIEPLESRLVLSAMIGLTAADQLVTFDSTRPDVPNLPVAISGLQPGEAILAIDSRPSTAQVYGLGSTGRFYTLDPSTGAALQVGAGPIATPLSGSQFSIDFDTNRGNIRLVSDDGEDLRVDPETLAVTVDPNLAYDAGDAGAGTTPQVVAAAYNAGGGPLYEIDARRSALVTQGTHVPSSSADQNTGLLFTVSPLGLPVSAPVGFGFTAEGVGLVSFAPAGSKTTNLYQTPLGGQAGPLTLVGSFPTSLAIRDLAKLVPSPRVFAVTASNALISFASNAPGSLLSSHALLGLQPGETVQTIAFRPATGQLYGFGSSGRLYTIDPGTGSASAVSAAPIAPAYDGTKASIEFLSGQDEILLATRAGQALRLDPNTGAADQVYPPLAYASQDVAAGTAPSIVAQSNATVTITTPQGASAIVEDFGIDSAHDTLITVSVGGAGGAVATTGTLGRDVTDDAGLDTYGGSETLAALTDVGSATSALYRVYPQFNPTAGGGTTPVPVVRIGAIAGGSVVRGIAIAPAGMPQFQPSAAVAREDVGSAFVYIGRVGGSSGPLQVTYSTIDGGTARAGIDYTPVSGTLTFGDGETLKAFSIPITAGAFSDGTRTVALSASVVSSNGLTSPIVTGTLTIVATIPRPPSAYASQDLAFRGPATAISSLDVGFDPGADPALVGNAANYVISGTTATHPGRITTIPVASVFYDATARVAHVVFATPFALKTYRSLQVEGRGFGVAGSNALFGFSVLRGSVVRYTDPDGDRVTLGVTGRNAKIVVVRNGGGDLVSAWVEGHGRSVFGSLVHTRKSNRRTTIAQFTTNGAKLRLPKSFDVTQVPTIG